MERKGAGTPNNLKVTSYSVQLFHAEPERVMVSGIAKCVSPFVCIQHITDSSGLSPS